MEFRIEKLDHVQVAAPKGCEEEARRFYGEVLGLAEVEKPEPLRGRGGVWFEFGNSQLHIGVEEPFAAARKAHPAFVVNGFEELQEALGARGIEVKNDTSIPGSSRFFVSDPFGNRLEFLKEGFSGN